MSDAEHELLLENAERSAEIARLRDLATRALRAAIAAQDRADGGHEVWLADALRELDPT
jgi:hypothetical protein